MTSLGTWQLQSWIPPEKITVPYPKPTKTHYFASPCQIYIGYHVRNLQKVGFWLAKGCHALPHCSLDFWEDMRELPIVRGRSIQTLNSTALVMRTPMKRTPSFWKPPNGAVLRTLLPVRLMRHAYPQAPSRREWLRRRVWRGLVCASGIMLRRGVLGGNPRLRGRRLSVALV